MKTNANSFPLLQHLLLTLLLCLGLGATFHESLASGGSGSGGGSTGDTIKVSKCYCNATATSGGEMLIKASSSDATARLFAYRPDGSYIGEVQNGGGSRYGGTVMPYQPYDPINVTITSSKGGSITVPTTPFQL